MAQPWRADQQRNLFELDDPPIRLCDQHKQRLMPLVQALLLETLAPPTSKEVGNDEGQL
jgi:hypothetical protein